MTFSRKTPNPGFSFVHRIEAAGFQALSVSPYEPAHELSNKISLNWLAEGLRRRGVDVLTVQEAAKTGLSDRKQLALH